jgi:hypothetical protein
MITYPSDWRAASDKPGMVILADPRAPWGRPPATIVVIHVKKQHLDTSSPLLSAARGTDSHFISLVNSGSDLDGSQDTSQVGDGRTAQYVIVGVAA